MSTEVQVSKELLAELGVNLGLIFQAQNDIDDLVQEESSARAAGSDGETGRGTVHYFSENELEEYLMERVAKVECVLGELRHLVGLKGNINPLDELISFEISKTFSMLEGLASELDLSPNKLAGA